MTNLEVLSLAVNRLTGTVPSVLGVIPNLTYVAIEGNNLGGGIALDLCPVGVSKVLMADCDKVACGCCTECFWSTSTTQQMLAARSDVNSPTVSPVLPSTPFPTKMKTAAPSIYINSQTVAPSIHVNVQTAAPSIYINAQTVAPSITVPAITAVATDLPSDLPSALPSKMPSSPPTSSANLCKDTIFVNSTCSGLPNGQIDVFVQFDYCQPDDTDWIGIFPRSSRKKISQNSNISQDSALLWAFPCGTQSCSGVVSSGTVQLALAAGQALSQTSSYVAFLIHNHTATSAGYIFRVDGINCNPQPGGPKGGGPKGGGGGGRRFRRS